MTDPHASDERLAGAFRALSDTSETGDLPDDLRERIWLAVSGALPPEERREIVERTVTDPACAEAWRAANELWLASQSSAGRGTALPSRTATRWAPRWLAAAAVLVLGAAVAVVSLLDRERGDEFRASSELAVESLLPADMPLPRDAFRLRWTPGTAGSRYEVRVTTDDLQVLATGADLTTPEFAVERALLEELPAGARVLWQVDVTLPDGGRITSPTFAATVE